MLNFTWMRVESTLFPVKIRKAGAKNCCKGSNKYVA